MNKMTDSLWDAEKHSEEEILRGVLQIHVNRYPGENINDFKNRVNRVQQRIYLVKAYILYNSSVVLTNVIDEALDCATEEKCSIH
jgi:hypothetical protein